MSSLSYEDHSHLVEEGLHLQHLSDLSLECWKESPNPKQGDKRPPKGRKGRGRSLSPMKLKSNSLIGFLLPKNCTARIAPISNPADPEFETDENSIPYFKPLRKGSLQSCVSDSVLVEKIIEKPVLSTEEVWRILERERSERMILEERNRRLQEKLDNERLLYEETKIELEEVNIDLLETQEIVARAGLDWAKEKRSREILEGTCSKLKESLRHAQTELNSWKQKYEELKSEKEKVQEDSQNQIMQVILSGKIREHGFYMKLAETRDIFNEKMQVLQKLVEEFEIRLKNKRASKEESHQLRELKQLSGECLMKLSRCLRLELPEDDTIIDSEAFRSYYRSSNDSKSAEASCAGEAVHSKSYPPDTMVFPADYYQNGEISHKKLSRDLNWSMENEDTEHEIAMCDEVDREPHRLSINNGMGFQGDEDCQDYVELSDFSVERVGSSKTQFGETSSCSNSLMGDGHSSKPKLKEQDENWLLPLKMFTEKRKSDAAATRLLQQSKTYAQVGKSRNCNLFTIW